MADDLADAAFYPADTIVSCPAMVCGARLYRLCAAAPFGDVVANESVLLLLVNDTIPARKVWDPLACPLCGAAVVHEGQLNTAEQGW